MGEGISLMRPGSTVVCINATNSCHYLHVGMQLIVQDVVHTDDGRIMVSFTSGPARMWPWEQFREA